MEEINDSAKREKVRVISIDLIDDFPDHPFQVKDDEDMEKLVESIRNNGVLTPIIVRKKAKAFKMKAEAMQILELGSDRVEKYKETADSLIERLSLPS